MPPKHSERTSRERSRPPWEQLRRRMSYKYQRQLGFPKRGRHEDLDEWTDLEKLLQSHNITHKLCIYSRRVDLPSYRYLQVGTPAFTRSPAVMLAGQLNIRSVISSLPTSVNPGMLPPSDKSSRATTKTSPSCARFPIKRGTLRNCPADDRAFTSEK